MRLREEDLTLIHALQLAPRATWAQLADVLGTHPTTLAGRWERLRESGLAWVTGNLVGTSMETSLSFVELECSLDQKRVILERVCAIPEVASVEESARNRDLMLTVIAPSLAELGRDVMPMITQIPGITKYQVSVCTALHAGGQTWHLNTLDRAQEVALRALNPAPEPHRDPLPASHWRVVHELVRDGRASAAQIARAIGVHPTTASRQLNRVLRSNVLTFRCEIAQSESGFPVSIQWFGRLPAGEHAAAAQALRRHPNVRFCASTTGTTNFTIVMWLRSVSDVLTGELSILKLAPEIELVESTLTLRFVKRIGWMLDEDGAAVGEPTLPRLPARVLESGVIF
ncbi:Lrp/AsnC family transcriptional regulator [Mycetocola spongiae]|uniref:Lrp/AsnC family transcriptional regulator n=1 Tax=Mycetocola spongiae TaxID=2859226 RepID=UPI001CF501F5|nr:Lrp/AsnC family transcriptional regulator [Mycetocola spongiae]UCR88890.1 Lrp/AsnC family transcriptional regulator [Mycetocola spongiae]